MSATYTAAAYVLDFNFTDTNGSGGTYLIGQSLGAQLNNPSGLASTQTWSVTGGSPFASYTHNMTGATWSALTNVTSTSLGCYFATAGTPTISCIGTLTPQAPSVPAKGLSFTIPGKLVTTITPTFGRHKTGSGQQGGMANGVLCPINCTAMGLIGTSYFDPDLGSNGATMPCGIFWGASVTSPATGGGFCFEQITTLGATQSNATETDTLEYETSAGTPPTYTLTGLDTNDPIFPNLGDTSTVQTNLGGTTVFDTYNTFHFMFDNPFEAFNSGFTSMKFSNWTFSTNLMYVPPGTASAAVPLYLMTWALNCSATQQGGVWSSHDMAFTPNGPVTNYGSFPTWAGTVSAGGSAWVKNQ